MHARSLDEVGPEGNQGATLFKVKTIDSMYNFISEDNQLFMERNVSDPDIKKNLDPEH